MTIPSLTNLLSIIDNRIYNWNALRYPQEYCHDLTTSLLCEELSEYQEAINNLDGADALGDLYFVTVGALWKLQIGRSYRWSLPEVDHFLTLNDGQTPGGFMLANLIQDLAGTPDEFTKEIRFLLLLLHNAILLEFVQSGYSYDNICAVLAAICVSNDTKLIKSLRSFEKGSLKGPGFMPPTADLQVILAESGHHNG